MNQTTSEAQDAPLPMPLPLPEEAATWPEWKKELHTTLQTRNALLQRFPKALRDFSQPKVPLKVDILADFYHAAPDLPRKQIRAAVRDYCNGISYHSVMFAGAPRIDLNGKVVGRVTAEEAAYHAAENQRKLLQKERKTAQRAERLASKGE